MVCPLGAGLELTLSVNEKWVSSIHGTCYGQRHSHHTQWGIHSQNLSVIPYYSLTTSEHAVIDPEICGKQSMRILQIIGFGNWAGYTCKGKNFAYRLMGLCKSLDGNIRQSRPIMNICANMCLRIKYQKLLQSIGLDVAHSFCDRYVNAFALICR